MVFGGSNIKNTNLFLKRLAALAIDLITFYFPARVAGFNHGELAIVWFLYEAVLVSQFQGSTLGKWRMGLRVVTDEKKPVPLSKAFLRAAMKLLSTAVFLLGDLWMLKDQKSRTWHDELAGTIVVNRVQ